MDISNVKMFLELIDCEKCKVLFHESYLNDDLLCSDCVESQIKCESCSFMCDESELNSEGVCSDCVESDDMYAQQNEYLN